MLDAAKKYLRSTFGTEDQEGPAGPGEKTALRVAIAALLVEMSRADFVEEKEERTALTDLLKGHFFLEKDEAEALLGEAGSKAEEAVSLHEFTRAIHENMSEPQKHRLLEMLLEVALADGKLNKHERHLLAKVADLIYVRQGDYMRILARALDFVQ